MNPKDVERLTGVEWAAIRMHRGAKPLIVPLREGGNWLYIERTGEDEFEIRIVEPLGTKRTSPKKIDKKTAAQITAAASRRGSNKNRTDG